MALDQLHRLRESREPRVVISRGLRPALALIRGRYLPGYRSRPGAGGLSRRRRFHDLRAGPWSRRVLEAEELLPLPRGGQPTSHGTGLGSASDDSPRLAELCEDRSPHPPTQTISPESFVTNDDVIDSPGPETLAARSPPTSMSSSPRLRRTRGSGNGIGGFDQRGRRPCDDRGHGWDHRLHYRRPPGWR